MALRLDRLHPLLPQSSIGLDLGRSADGTYVVRAVGVRGKRIRWRRTATLDSDPDLAIALGTFLRSLPRRPLGPPSVLVALGPASIQLKRLPRLPSLADPRALTSLVRENVSRFFVRNGVPLVTSTLRVDGAGDAWGAAVERPLLEALARACAVAKMRLKRIVPVATVLGYALASSVAQESEDRAAFRQREVNDPSNNGIPQPHAGRGSTTSISTQTGTPALPDDAFGSPTASGSPTIVVAAVEWADGPATYLLDYESARLVKSRRRLESPGSISTDVSGPQDLIAALRPDGWLFAAAYAAAVAGRRQPIAWRSPSSPQSIATSRVRRAPAIGVCVLAVAAAFVSAPIGASVATARLDRHEQAIAAARAQVMETADSLRQVTSLLQDAAAFADARRPVTPFLAALTVALPARTALSSIHIDTAGGTLVALTPNASDLVSRLERVPGLVAPELTGPVTSRPVLLPRTNSPGSAPGSPITLNEVTIRFRLTPIPNANASQRTFADGKPIP